jgi:hypothetical protein
MRCESNSLSLSLSRFTTHTRHRQYEVYTVYLFAACLLFPSSLVHVCGCVCLRMLTRARAHVRTRTRVYTCTQKYPTDQTTLGFRV